MRDIEQEVVDKFHKNTKKFNRASIISLILVIITGLIVFSLSIDRGNGIVNSILLTVIGMSFLGMFLSTSLLFYYSFDLNMPSLQGKYNAIMRHRYRVKSEE